MPNQHQSPPHKARLRCLATAVGSILFLATIIGALAASAQDAVMAQDPGAQIIEVRVAASSDDAEEAPDGGMYLDSSDLELVYDGGDQTVGMRFNGADITQGATIVTAYVQFQVDEKPSDATSLTISGQADDNAGTFTGASGNIPSRPRTVATVAWEPTPWPIRGEAGPDQWTPDISAVIQEIVDRQPVGDQTSWVCGNSLVIIVTGTGERVAEAFDGDPAGAPLLHVEYVLGQHPVVTIDGPENGATLNVGEVITFSGSANDGQDGDLTGGLSWLSSLDGAIGSDGSFTRSDLSAGLHIITATVTDSDGLTGLAIAEISVFSDTSVLVGAGDIAKCSYVEDEETAKLLDNIPGIVFTLGDNVYPDGTAAEFSDCYDPTWGRHKVRTRPSAGNHDHHTPGATGYYDYFGAAAGEAGKGYYSYDAGEWHIIVLNSNCTEVRGCDSASPQGQWLQADLAANPSACTLAYWHEPLFSSGAVHGGDARMLDFWQLLYNAGADVVLNGHEHHYERFALQDPNGLADPGRGIRQFVVGTGGAGLYAFETPHPNSEVRNSVAHGVLKLTLHPTSYDWEFVPIAGQTFSDTGSAACVSAGKNPPLANDDSANTSEDTAVAIDVTVNDSDPDGNLDATSANSTCDNGSVGCVGADKGSLTDLGDGTITYSPNPGFSGSDGFVYEICDVAGLCDVAVVHITVNPSAPVIFEVRVADSYDDAEENSSGRVSLTSSDLEMTLEKTEQTVGLRFNGVNIPQAATIVSAYIQFQVDETNSEATALTIQGQAADNALAFDKSTGNISDTQVRSRTAAAVSWEPAPWTNKGEAGPDQQTADLVPIIQEIVGRDSWTSGNSLVIIITGSGKRVAESFNGDQAGAPLLHVEYVE